MGDLNHADPAKQGPHFTNPEHKDLYGYPAGQYRKDLTTMVKDDDFPNAFQLNQLGYAQTPAFHDSKGTVGGKVADDSYGRMVDNMGEVKYATGKNPATDFASTSQPLAYQRAEMYLSREAANTKEWPSIERPDEVMKYFMDRAKNGIPSNPPEMKHAPTDAMDIS